MVTMSLRTRTHTRRLSLLLFLALALCLIPATAGAQTIDRVTPLRAGPATLSTTSSGVCLNTTDCVQLNLGGYAGVSVQVTGTCGTCTYQFEATVDGTNWVATSMVPSNSTTPVTNATTTGVWQGSISANTFRVRLSARSSGSFVVSIRATVAFAKLSITDSGAAVPGGADTQVQFNDGGSFGGDSALTWDKVANALVLTSGSLTVNGNAVNGALAGSSGSIGGGVLTAGACASGTASVTGATTAMAVIATPVTYPGDGTDWKGYVSAADTVTVKVCALVAVTPTASVYRVRVIQ